MSRDLSSPSLHVPTLQIVRPRWGNDAPLESFIQQAAADGFNAIELGLPTSAADQRQCIQMASDGGLGLIGEVATGDWWVPQPHRSEQDHLDDLCVALDACVACGAWHLNAMTGYDAWSIERSVEYFGRCLEAAETRGVQLCIETHRSRSLNTPWVTVEILKQLPDLPLTCDFSHWVVVTERLLEGCEEAVAAAVNNVHHIHARVGHAQGPQVPDPAAPEYAPEVAAHLGWWQQCWESMAARGFQRITMNPEFGVDRYLPLLPYSQKPVADLASIQCWMATMLREAYLEWLNSRMG